MAKKNKVKMYCQICKKNTEHEDRSADGQECCICLRCKQTSTGGEDAALNYEEHLKAEGQKLDRMIEMERMRIYRQF